MWFFYLAISIVFCVIWGCVVNMVISNKGYDENWFWWGFFFGFLALIVALTKPDANYVQATPVVSDSRMEELTKKTREEDLLKNGGWRCSVCRTVNASYTGTCRCGNTRATDKNILQQRQQEERKRQAEIKNQQEVDNIQKLKGYKDLLDAGVLTQEEFDKKKQEILK